MSDIIVTLITGIKSNLREKRRGAPKRAAYTTRVNKLDFELCSLAGQKAEKGVNSIHNKELNEVFDKKRKQNMFL